MEAVYNLRTPANVANIDALTLQGTVSWTQHDGTGDPLVTEIRIHSPGGDTWQPIAFPFQATPVSSYVDASGNVFIRFSDSTSVRRERKDVLTVDYLLGQVTLGNTAPVIPTSPMDLHVTGVSSSSVTLNWTDSANETGYSLWRYTPIAGWTIMAELSADVTSFTDRDLVSGTTYTYVVRAFNAEAYADSGSLEVTTASGLLAPTNLRTSTAKGAVNLSWTDTNTIESGYEILRGPAVDSLTRLTLVPANTTTFADRTVVRGSTYFYQVRGIQDTITGPVSSTVSVVAK
jgi:hypothetical protein